MEMEDEPCRFDAERGPSPHKDTAVVLPPEVTLPPVIAVGLSMMLLWLSASGDGDENQHLHCNRSTKRVLRVIVGGGSTVCWGPCSPGDCTSGGGSELDCSLASAPGGSPPGTLLERFDLSARPICVRLEVKCEVRVVGCLGR